MQCTENDIKLVILDFYDPLTISDAKRAMWEHCGELLPPFESRRSSPVGGSAHEKDLNDIMFAVKEIDKRDCSQTTLPVFVAVRLDNLPRMTPGEVDPISLLERVTMLETLMRNVQQCVTRHDSALAAVTHTATRNSQRTELIDPRVKLSPSLSQISTAIPSTVVRDTAAPSVVETTARSSRTDAAAAYDQGAYDTSAPSAVETPTNESSTDASNDNGAYDTLTPSAVETMAATSRTYDTLTTSAVETMAATSRTDAAYDTLTPSAVETMAATSRTDAAHDTLTTSAIETTANSSPTEASTKPSWSTVAASRDRFVLPKYHEKKAARKQSATSSPVKRTKTMVFYGTKSSNTIKSAPRRLELFVFNVDSSIDEERLREFITSEHVDVLEIERTSKEGAWTQSFRVLVTAPNPRCTLDNDFWPRGIGCRQYYRKRPHARNTPDDANM